MGDHSKREIERIQIRAKFGGPPLHEVLKARAYKPMKSEPYWKTPPNMDPLKTYGAGSWIHVVCTATLQDRSKWRPGIIGHSCYHRAQIPMDLMVRLYGGDLPFDTWRRRLKCVDCGGERGRVMVEAPRTLGTGPFSDGCERTEEMDIVQVPKWMHRHILPASPPQKLQPHP